MINSQSISIRKEKKRKVDLVMWAKNGAFYLKKTLKRINEVIPNEAVENRIFVDDDSTDNSREIAKSFQWKTYSNEGMGIGDGANTALRYVKSPYFISFEQDLVLAKNWWEKIPKYLNNKNVIAAQGVRLPDLPVLRELQEYRLERNRKLRRMTHSMDNTIYKTEIMREIGGFPRLPGAGVDSILVQKVLKTKYKWITDYSVVSLHLRKNVWQDVNRFYWYGLVAPIVSKYDPSINLLRIVKTFFFSPIRGFHIAIIKNCPQLFIIYPVIRFNVLKGYLDGMKYRKKTMSFN